jgi:hypothetical protein
MNSGKYLYKLTSNEKKPPINKKVKLYLFFIENPTIKIHS